MMDEKCETFILSFIPYAYALAHRRAHDVEWDDIVQQCMLVVIQVAEHALTLQRPRGYVRTAMIHAADNYVQSVRRRDEEWKDMKDMPEYARPVEEYAWLYVLIECLPPIQRSAIGHSFGLEGYGRLTQEKQAAAINRVRQSVAEAKKRGIQNLRLYIEKGVKI